MREKLVPLIIVLFLAGVISRYQGMSEQKQVGIDNVYRDFSSLANVLPPTANVSVAAIMAPKSDSEDVMRGFLFIRFVLTPRHFSNDAMQYDTVLTLFDRKPTVAEELSVTKERMVLWSKRGDNCLYLLTCSPQTGNMQNVKTY